LLELRGTSVETGKVRTPVGSTAGPRLRPSKPVVARTGAFPVFTIVAVPTIRSPSLCTDM
jgi:hypothetical protein